MNKVQQNETRGLETATVADVRLLCIVDVVSLIMGGV
jgi:hypothetical protein